MSWECYTTSGNFQGYYIYNIALDYKTLSAFLSLSVRFVMLKSMSTMECGQQLYYTFSAAKQFPPGFNLIISTYFII